ncbi:MAG: hypothetical protein IJS88_02120 [Alphaproteobacteria bacterium]|nr:hypothetical protein [Alphaproteobacteria bacterium]
MEYKEIIRNGRIVELSAAVFGKTIGDAGNTYADSLDGEEEKELVQRLVSDEKPEEWLGWMAEYRRYYPLSNVGIAALIDNLQSEAAEIALVEEFSRYGYTENQAVMICRKALNNEAGTYRQLIETICASGRIFFSDFFSDLPLLLARLDERDKDEDLAPHYAETYRKSLRKYREDNNLDRFYDQQKTPA